MSSEYSLEPDFVYDDSTYVGYTFGDRQRRVYRISNPSKKGLAIKLSDFFVKVFHLFIYKSELVNDIHFRLEKYSRKVSTPICRINWLSHYIRFCVGHIIQIFKRRELRALGVMFISKKTNERKGSYEIVVKRPNRKFVRIYGVHKRNSNLKKKGLPKFVKNMLGPALKALYQAVVPKIERGKDEEISIKCYVRRRRGKKHQLKTDSQIDNQLLRIRKKKRGDKKRGTLPLIHPIICNPIQSQYVNMTFLSKEFANTPATA